MDLGWILDVGNYGRSLETWVEGEQKRKESFDRYVVVVKPVIHRYYQSKDGIRSCDNIGWTAVWILF